MAQQGRRPWKGCMDILFFLFSTSSFFYVARSEKIEVEVDTAALAGGADNVVVEDQREQSVDYLIVGAGSGGLQLALFFEKYGRTYKILEKESVVASLWTKFPRFEELISVNKWVSNETQKERYDWHSFLESSLKMQDVTESYFPKGKEWHKYMALVAKDEGILEKVEFETQVERIALDDSPCVFLTNGEKRCANKRVFLGTGLKEKEEPFLEAMGGIPYSRVTKDMARHKRVCILGNGNSGFELAQNIFGLTEKTVIYGRNPPRFSAVTRYTGDVRLKYVQVLENFHGKLLDTVYWMEYTNFFGMPKYSFKYKNMKGIPKLNSTQLREASYLTSVAHWLAEWRCSAFFIATGVKSVAPEGITFGKRFANTNDWCVIYTYICISLLLELVHANLLFSTKIIHNNPKT